MIAKDCELTELEFQAGAYDRCLTCTFLGQSCDGPNILTMKPERRVVWGQELKLKRQKEDGKCTNAYIAEQGQLSKTTVDNFFQGKLEDPRISTLEGIFKPLIGSWGQHPCAMVSQGDNVIYVDNPDLFAELKRLEAENSRLEILWDDASTRVKHLLTQIATYETQLEYMRKLLDERADYLRVKDRYLERLIRLLAKAMPESEIRDLLTGMNFETL